MKVTPSFPQWGGTPRGGPLDPPIYELKLIKKFQAIITLVRVIFRYVLVPVKILKLPAPPCLREAPRRVFLIIIISFFKEIQLQQFL
jgi:hypothetical protein